MAQQLPAVGANWVWSWGSSSVFLLQLLGRVHLCVALLHVALYVLRSQS